MIHVFYFFLAYTSILDKRKFFKYKYLGDLLAKPLIQSPNNIFTNPQFNLFPIQKQITHCVKLMGSNEILYFRAIMEHNWVGIDINYTF